LATLPLGAGPRWGAESLGRLLALLPPTLLGAGLVAVTADLAPERAGLGLASLALVLAIAAWAPADLGADRSAAPGFMFQPEPEAFTQADARQPVRPGETPEARLSRVSWAHLRARLARMALWSGAAVVVMLSLNLDASWADPTFVVVIPLLGALQNGVLSEAGRALLGTPLPTPGGASTGPRALSPAFLLPIGPAFRRRLLARLGLAIWWGVILITLAVNVVWGLSGNAASPEFLMLVLCVGPAHVAAALAGASRREIRPSVVVAYVTGFVATGLAYGFRSSFAAGAVGGITGLSVLCLFAVLVAWLPLKEVMRAARG
jgi:hypothetical protein